MIIYLNIEIEENLTVELSCNMEMKDDSFDHEFGTEKIPHYPAPKGEIEYNKELYSDMECDIIDEHIKLFYDEIVEQFCDDYEWILKNKI